MYFVKFEGSRKFIPAKFVSQAIQFRLVHYYLSFTEIKETLFIQK